MYNNSSIDEYGYLKSTNYLVGGKGGKIVVSAVGNEDTISYGPSRFMEYAVQ